MKRGEVWWARVDKRRPVVLLSRDEAYAVRKLASKLGELDAALRFALGLDEI